VVVIESSNPSRSVLLTLVSTGSVKYSFITVDRKDIGLLGSVTVQDSLSILIRLYRPY
jgi:hypothetical protein